MDLLEHWFFSLEIKNTHSLCTFSTIEILLRFLDFYICLFRSLVDSFMEREHYVF